MVFLSQLDVQFPWTPNAPEDYSDKEILTQRIAFEDANRIWRPELHQCLPGYAYVGYRILTVNSEVPKFVCLRSDKYHNSPLLSNKTDTPVHGPTTRNWTRFTYPIPSRLCALDEDEPCLEIHFEKPTWGAVEFLAQRFHDFPEEDTDFIYYRYFIENSPDDEWLHTPRQEIYRYSTVKLNDLLVRDFKIISIPVRLS